jgi:hypothetical protein
MPRQQPLLNEEQALVIGILAAIIISILILIKLYRMISED